MVSIVCLFLILLAQFLLEEADDLTIVQHAITLVPNPIASNSFLDVVSDCAVVDFDKDGQLDIAIAISSSIPANNGFFWYRYELFLSIIPLINLDELELMPLHW